MIRSALYAVIIICLVAGAALDARGGDWKSATLAALYAICTAVVFFWR